MAEPNPELSEASPEGGEFGFEQLKELVGLFLRAPKRHRRLAASALLITLTLGILAVVLWPRTYSCSVRMLAQKNMLLPALGSTNSGPEDNPTKYVADTILQRENLVATIKQLDLMDRWEPTRAPILRFKDKIFSVLGPRSEDDKLLDMITTLETKLSVATDDSSITISVDWPDKNLAFEIVSYLQKNFLEARYDKNVNVVTEAVRILQERAKPQAADVDAALADLTKIEAERRAAAEKSGSIAGGTGGPRRTVYVRRVAAAASSGSGSAGTAPDQTTDDVAADLEDVRRRIRLYKEDRDRELLQAQNQLADARATLGPLHPTVVALNEKISQLSQDSGDLQALQARERQLVSQIAKATVVAPAPAATGGLVVAGGGPATAASGTSASLAPPSTTDLQQDPEVAVALNRLQAVTAKYNDLLSRIEAANIQLDVTRAAFKFQYTVVKPAELPRRPSKPKANLMLGATIALALLLMVLLPGGVDLLRGRFIEPWQVARNLDLPLLGELNPPR